LVRHARLIGSRLQRRRPAGPVSSGAISRGQGRNTGTGTACWPP
jgi:hypothetical protein